MPGQEELTRVLMLMVCGVQKFVSLLHQMMVKKQPMPAQNESDFSNCLGPSSFCLSLKELTSWEWQLLCGHGFLAGSPNLLPLRGERPNSRSQQTRLGIHSVEQYISVAEWRKGIHSQCGKAKLRAIFGSLIRTSRLHREDQNQGGGLEVCIVK